MLSPRGNLHSDRETLSRILSLKIETVQSIPTLGSTLRRYDIVELGKHKISPTRSGGNDTTCIATRRSNLGHLKDVGTRHKRRITLRLASRLFASLSIPRLIYDHPPSRHATSAPHTHIPHQGFHFRKQFPFLLELKVRYMMPSYHGLINLLILRASCKNRR